MAFFQKKVFKISNEQVEQLKKYLQKGVYEEVQSIITFLIALEEIKEDKK
jgi:hypothetical protein